MVFEDFFQQIFFLMREIEWKKFLRIKEIFFSDVKKVFFFFFSRILLFMCETQWNKFLIWQQGNEVNLVLVSLMHVATANRFGYTVTAILLSSSWIIF